MSISRVVFSFSKIQSNKARESNCTYIVYLLLDQHFRIKTKGIKTMQLIRERTCRVTTRLHPLTRVKHCRAGLVLGQVTDRLGRVSLGKAHSLA